MATTIVTKYGSGAPADTDLVRGELAVDTENGRLYTETSGGAVIEIGRNPSGNVDVTGSATFTGTASGATASSVGNKVVIDDAENGISILSSTSGAGYLIFGDSDDNDIGMLIYDHSANALRTYVNGAERVTISSAGDVGIGTDSPTLASGWGRVLHVQSASTGSSIRLADATSGTSGEVGFLMGQYGGSTYLINRDSGNMYFWTGGQERARLDASGNWLLGKTANDNTTAGHRFTASGFTSHVIANDYPLLLNRLSSDGALLTFRKDSTTVGSIGVNDDKIIFGTANAAIAIDQSSNIILPYNPATPGARDAAIDLGYASGRFKDLYLSGGALTSTVKFLANTTVSGSDATIFRPADNTMAFSTNGAERGRFDSSGNLLVGNTDITNSRLGVRGTVLAATLETTSTNTGHEVLVLKKPNATGRSVAFIQGSSDVGNISVTSSATTYNTSSDQRLKENIVDAPSASDDIDAIQVRSFDWKADGSHQKYGMVAQELQTVAPEAVSAPEDPEEMMGVDYSKLVPMMLKEIQSLRARVAQLES